MIKRLRHVKGFGVFTDFAPDAETLPDFEKRNLIYGWNYSGKTTFSRVFRSFETGVMPTGLSEGSFALELSDGCVFSERDLEALPIPIRVFNSDFVRENLSWEDAGDAEPILILGEESISLQRELEAYERQLARRSKYQSLLEERNTKQEKAIEEAGTSVARTVREQCGRTPFDRRHLQAVVDGLRGDLSKYLLDETAYQAETRLRTAEERDKVAKVAPMEEPATLVRSVENELRATAEQRTIERLKANPDAARWVQKGIELHDPDGECWFCERPLPQGWLDTLGGHYSEAYRELQERVQILREQVECWRTRSEVPLKSVLYQDLRETYVAAIAEYDAALEVQKALCDDVEATLRAKAEDVTKELEPPKSLHDLDSSAINSALEAVNAVLVAHNERSENVTATRAAAESRMVEHHAARYVEDNGIGERELAILDLERRAEKNTRTIEKLKAAVARLRSQLSEEERGAEEVNKYLTTFFGVDAIQVHWEVDGKYRLVRRGGGEARSLSEGEKTGVAFSYFLASLGDRRLGATRPVVYIDDPISSLDSNHLYNAFAVIKATLEDHPQIFLSTHDYGFFRLLARDSFFKEGASGKRRGAWYLVRRVAEGKSELFDLPQSLRGFQSEYHHLFGVCHAFHTDPESNESLAVLLPNILRRTLEIFTHFKMPARGSDLRMRLEKLTDDNRRVQLVYKFVNHGSHSDAIDFVAEPPQLEECSTVLAEAMELMRTIDEAHFQAMVELAEA